MEKKIDLESLAAILNPAIFIVLLGGLLLHFDVVPLIVVGVVGYAVWGVLNIVVRRNRQLEYAEQNKKKKKGAVAPPKLVDMAFVASLLNPLVLIVLFVGILQGWDMTLLITIGVVGYGTWFLLTMMDRNQKKTRRSSGKKKRR